MLARVAFAGLWERWKKGDEPIESCIPLTCPANAVIGPVHDRMPVLLAPGEYARWLDPEATDPAGLMPLLGPYPAEAMTAYPLGRMVNDPRRDGPGCIEPAG